MSSSVTPTSTPIAGSNPWASKKVFTTGEAAELCKISQQTIIRCFDAGRLGGFRVPGSRFRRIPRADLIHFMQSNQIPTGLLDVPECKRILAVDDDPRIIELMMDTIGRDRRFDLRTASTRDAQFAAYRKVGDVVATLLMEHPGEVRLYLQECRAPAAGPRVPIVELSKVVSRYAISITAQAQAHRILKPIPVPVSALTVVGAAERLLLAVLQEEDIGNPLEVPEALTTLILDGLKA